MQKGDKVILATQRLSNIHPSLEKYNPLGVIGEIVKVKVSKPVKVLSSKRRPDNFGGRFHNNDNFEMENAEFTTMKMRSDCIVEWSNGLRNSYSFKDLVKSHV